MAVQHPQDFARPFAVTSSRMESGLERHARRVWPIAAALLVASATASAQQTPSEHQLQEVVVSASGFEQSIKEAPASITVITRKELESNRVGSIAEALSHVEGIDVSDGIGKTGGLEIRMRGMSSKFTLILIDGRRQNTAGGITPNAFGDSATSFMPPPSAIERIEVIRGPMATLYGSDAMGGVVNIITRKVGKEWTGEFTVEGTLNEHRDYGDSQAGSVYLSGPLKEGLLGLQVRARKYHRDASDIQWNGRNPATTLLTGQNPVRADINTVGARLSLTPNKDHDLSLDLDQSRQTYDNSRGQIGTLNTPTTINGYAPTQKFNRDQITLAHTWRLGNSVLESSLMRNETETIGRTIPATLTGGVWVAPPGKIAGAPRTLKSESTVFDTKLVTAIGSNMLTVGGQWWDAKMVDGIAVGTFSHTQTGIFAENEWRINKDLALTVGLRHDNHSTFGGATSPRAYLVWNGTDQWTFKGGVSKGYRTPSLEQLFDGVTGYTGQGNLDAPTYGNPNLKPESSISSEMAAYFDSLDGFRANVTVFKTDLKDAIGSESYNPAGTTSGTRPINVDKASIQGVEIGSSIEFARDWRLSANYTYTDSEQKSGPNIGKPLNNTPKHVVNTKLDWKATPKLNLWAQASYNSERYRTEDTRLANTKALLGDYKAYSLVNIGGNYKVDKSLTINMAINNLLDKNFAEYRPVRAANGTATYASEYIGNFERRRLWVSANYAF